MISRQVEHWRTYMLLEWNSTYAPPARVLARGVASTETRVDQPSPGNDVNVFIDVVYDEMLKSSVTANPPPEQNSRYERLTRAERRERQKKKRASAQERTKSQAREIKEKLHKLYSAGLAKCCRTRCDCRRTT